MASQDATKNDKPPQGLLLLLPKELRLGRGGEEGGNSFATGNIPIRADRSGLLSRIGPALLRRGISKAMANIEIPNINPRILLPTTQLEASLCPAATSRF